MGYCEYCDGECDPKRHVDGEFLSGRVWATIPDAVRGTAEPARCVPRPGPYSDMDGNKRLEFELGLRWTGPCEPRHLLRG